MEHPINTELSLCRQVRNQIFAEILAGTYPPGSQLPAARELCRIYQVGHCTMVKAIQLLQDEGVLYCRSGRRPEVRPQHERKNYLIAISAMEGQIDSPPFDYQHSPTGWLTFNALQARLTRDCMPSINLPCTALYQQYFDRIDGVIALRSSDHFQTSSVYSGKPMVTTFNNVPRKSVDNCIYPVLHDAMIQAAIHFLTGGVKQIWLLLVSRENHEYRFEVFTKFLQERQFDPANIHTAYVPDICAAGAHQIFQETIRPQLKLPVGIIAVGDLIALGAMQAMLKLGLKPKRDFFLIGGSGLPEAEQWLPALTTISTSFEEKADQAVTMLYELIRNPLQSLPARAIQAKLIVRQT